MKDKHILIIDPDLGFRESLISLFMGEMIVEARSSVTTAAELMKNVRLDCIIMDVNLPDMKGHQAVKILKSIDPAVQVIITAAENSREQEMLVRQQDIVYYHIKSFDREELKLAVENVFRKLGKLAAE